MSKTKGGGSTRNGRDSAAQRLGVKVFDGTVVQAGATVGDASVSARVVGEEKGPKIRGFTYKNKSNQRKRWGHRQKYTTIEITGITRG